MRIFIPILLLLAFVIQTTTGCVKNIENTGYSFKAQQLASLKKGESLKTDVRRALGSPSATSDFGKEVWYYIGTQYESIIFLDPKIKEQTVIAVSFDETSHVDSVVKFTQDHARNVIISDEFTKTEGHDMSIIEQLLGNVGRFNTSK